MAPYNIEKRRILLIYICLMVITLAVYWQLNRCDFIDYDDPTYVTENVNIQHGITTDAIRWAFTSGYAANWHPLTWMSHMLDVQLFELNAHRHHLINLLFHIANTLLLFYVFHRMTKAPLKSAFVAALFALHPLHVESVAWVSERKDVLSTFFWMLTMAAYISYVEGLRAVSRPQSSASGSPSSVLSSPASIFRYLAVLIFFALGLMSKPMLVTLPFVLLLVDYWPLGRLTTEAGRGPVAKRTHRKAIEQTGKGREQIVHAAPDHEKQRFERKKTAQGIRTEAKTLSVNKRKAKPKRTRIVQTTVEEERPSDDRYQWALIRPLLWEKIPLFVLAALSCIVTFSVQQNGGAVTSTGVIPLGVRVGNALISYVAYIAKTIWPGSLAVFYPYSRTQPAWLVFGAFLLFLAASVIAIRKAKRLPYLAFGWLWFTGTMVPVIGIVQVGTQSMADRYTYVPLIGLFAAGTWFATALLQELKITHMQRKALLIGSSAAILASLFVVTYRQAGYWRSSMSLCNHALDVTENNDTILVVRGAAYERLGDYDQAMLDYERALAINPDNPTAYNDRGVVYHKQGNYRESILDYNRVIEIDPEFVHVYYNRGLAYEALRNPGNAIENFSKAIAMNREHEQAYDHRGAAYEKIGNHRQAIEDFNKVIETDPGYAGAYANRGAAYDGIGDFTRAIEDLNKAAAIDPKLSWVYNRRGAVYGKLGNYRQAVEDFSRGIDIEPGNIEAYYNRGATYGKLGNYRQEIEDFDRAIGIDPNRAELYYRRGAAYGKLEDYKKEIENYDKAIQINPGNAQCYNGRGIAFDKLGDYQRAISNFDRALEINARSAMVLNNRGNAYGKLRNYKRAIQDYSRAIEIDLHYVMAYYNRGVAYSELGQNGAANEDFKKAAQFDCEEAKEILRKRGVSW